jgi:hypothetical protein
VSERERERFSLQDNLNLDELMSGKKKMGVTERTKKLK